MAASAFLAQAETVSRWLWVTWPQMSLATVSAMPAQSLFLTAEMPSLMMPKMPLLSSDFAPDRAVSMRFCVAVTEVSMACAVSSTLSCTPST